MLKSQIEEREVTLDSEEQQVTKSHCEKLMALSGLSFTVIDILVATNFG